jgi:hypothetical protein
MAQFPTNAFSKADIANGVVSDATDVNDLAHEITAITDGYLNATARLNSSATTANTLSAGNSTFTAQIWAPSQPRCHVFHSVTQSASSNSTGRLTFDSELFDVGGMHSTASNPSRLTVPAASSGLYHCVASVFFNTVSTLAVLYLLKNSSRELSYQVVNGAIAGQTADFSGYLQCEAADILEIEYQTGASTASFGSASLMNRFMATKLY